jgi:DNA adenine methylase
MKRVISPLRYPGSKARITDLVAGLLEKNFLTGCHLYEPFAGGSAVSLGLLANGFISSATWVERDPMIFAFWRMVKDDPQQLIERMSRGKVSIAAWHRLQSVRQIKRPTNANTPLLGYAGLFFNRTCFSGIVGAGPIGGLGQLSAYKIDCRFNKKEIAAHIRDCAKLLEKVDVFFGDGIRFLEKNCLKMPRHSLVYIDPPYVTNGYKLYRYHFTKEQHETLADAVQDLRVPWLMSYDNHELVRSLYVGEQAKFVKTYQSLKGSRFVKEILLLSSDLELPSAAPPPEHSRLRGRALLSDYDH